MSTNKKAPTKRRSNRKPSKQLESVDEEEISGPAAPKTATTKKNRKSKNSDRTPLQKAYNPEVLNSATEFVKWAHGLGVDGLNTYWQTEMANKNPPMGSAPSFEANRDKNRYNDVICLEETRVKLDREMPTDGDYIHANYVKFPGYDRVYICAQGPLDNTAEDFWRMVWKERTPIIVNLTNCCETNAQGEKKNKCAKYWSPKEGESLQLGRFNVLTKKKEASDAKGRLDVYIVEVLPTGCSDSLIVRLIHSGVWPDGGVMGKPRLVLKIIKQIYNADTIATGSILVHCSAGIGRTGTLVLIDYILFRIFTLAKPANLLEAFLQLRQQRASAVQTPAQFVYIVLCISTYIGLATKTAHPELLEWATELEKDFKARGLEKPQQ